MAASPVTIGATIDVIEVTELLRQLGRNVSSLRPFWAWLDTQVSDLLREQFATRGARLGRPWKPIATVTQKVRIARRILSRRARARARSAAGRDTPLYDTGGLYAAWTKPGAPGSVRIVDALSYERGVDYAPDGVPVALLMQRGFRSVTRPIITDDGDVIFLRRRTPKRVPARRVVPRAWPEPVIRAWEGQLAAYVTSGAL